MKITVIGPRCVGLVSGACLSDFGHHVTCVDADPNKVEKLEAGEIPKFEPGLDQLVRDNHESGRLIFTTEL